LLAKASKGGSKEANNPGNHGLPIAYISSSSEQRSGQVPNAVGDHGSNADGSNDVANDSGRDQGAGSNCNPNQGDDGTGKGGHENGNKVKGKGGD